MLITFLFLIFSILSFYRKDNGINVKLYLVLLVFISIFLSYRSSDFPIYEQFFNKVDPLYQSLLTNNYQSWRSVENFEEGYTFLNAFFRMFGNNIEILYICCNAFILVIVYLFIKNKSDNIYKLLLPYFIFVFISIQVGIIRQAIAIAIFYFCVRYIVDRKFLKYLIGILIATLFHRTAIILLIFYFTITRIYSTKLLIIAFLVGMLIFLQIIPFSALSVFETLSSYVFPTMGDKLVFYIFQNQNLEAPSKFTLGIFENIGVFFLMLWIRSSLIKKELYSGFLNISFNFAIVFIFLYVYFFDVSSFIYRINYYFIFFKFFVIVKYIETLDSKYHRLLGNILLVVYCCIMMTVRLIQGY